jgi:hypothetical protein
MNTRRGFQFASALFFAVGLIAYGSVTPVRAQAVCPLTMRVTYSPVQQLTISDIDFEHFQSHRLLFTFDIQNRADSVVHAHLGIRMKVKLFNGTVNDPNAILLITKPFPIPPGGRTITNLNIGRGGSDIVTDQFSMSDQVKQKVEDVALATGKFPAGNYMITPSLTCENSGDASCSDCTKPIEFDIENPSRVQLRSPSDGETTNEFPLFEFYSDGSTNVLTVAEKLPDMSREDAIQRQPPMLEQTLNGQFSFLYAGGRPLEQGKTYVWRVVNKTTGAGGTDVDVTSPIGLFTVSGSGASGQLNDALLNQLEDLFGRRYPEIFRQIRNGHFQSTGTFSRDGSPIDENALLNLLNELRANPDGVDLSFE